MQEIKPLVRCWYTKDVGSQQRSRCRTAVGIRFSAYHKPHTAEYCSAVQSLHLR